MDSPTWDRRRPVKHPFDSLQVFMKLLFLLLSLLTESFAVSNRPLVISASSQAFYDTCEHTDARGGRTGNEIKMTIKNDALT